MTDSDTLVKFYDDNIDLEFFIHCNHDGVARIEELLDEHKEQDEEYSVDSYIEYLQSKGVQFETPEIKYSIYF